MAALKEVLMLIAVLGIFVTKVTCVDLTLDFKDEDYDLDLDEEEDDEERECHGTSVGFGYSGNLEMHYDNLRKRYTGCNHVIGNLEITNLVDPKMDYDLDFLKTIRYVSGAVLIGLITEVDVVPLLSLEVVRGNSTYWLQDDEYSFVVVLTAHSEDETLGLKQIQMPALKEITNGKVLFTENPALGYVNTIDWTPIMRGRGDDVHFYNNAFNESVTNSSVSPFCENGPRWGDDKALCQDVDDTYCHEDCDGRCFGPTENECCHNSCAVGCLGPGAEDCFACKDYIYDGHCAGFCPAKSYPLNQQCVKYE